MPRVKKSQVEEPVVQATEEQVIPKVEQPAPEQPEEDTSPIVVYGTTITENQLKHYKEQYKKIYFTDFAGQFFVWHRLNRADFTNIYNDTENIEDLETQTTEREVRFCEAAILYPEADVLDAMLKNDDILTSRICDEILYKSGFFKPQTVEL